MPNAPFGQSLPIDRNSNIFISLKSKKEKITIRIIGGGHYNGKHFTQEGEGWSVVDCPRIMFEAPCDTCDKFFELSKRLKEKKEQGADSKEIKRFEGEIRKVKPKITFFYPILNRDEVKAQIFKTSLSVRLKLEAFHNDGVNIAESDFIITRTEIPGSDYYSVTRKDSKDTLPLTDAEKQELNKAKSWNLEEMTKSKKSHEGFSDEEAPAEDTTKPTGKEEVDPDDIPF